MDKEFLKLLKKYFPASHILQNITYICYIYYIYTYTYIYINIYINIHIHFLYIYTYISTLFVT